MHLYIQSNFRCHDNDRKRWSHCKIGKTDENGIFKTVFSETGEYTITASKDGYISATTEIKILEYVVTVITNYGS